MIGVGSAAKIERSVKMGSKATRSAMGNASAISMGMNRKGLRMPEYHVMKRSPRSMLRGGSRVGLRDEKSVRLITNDSGYMNPTHHSARYKAKRQPAVRLNTTASSSMVYNGLSRSVCNDFRLTGACTNSLSKLQSMVG